jgi:tetrahydromethanopterin S-methyltransferase subunit G
MANNEEIMQMLVKLTEGQTGINNRLDKIDNRLNKIELVQEEIKESIEVLKEMTGKHEVDIKILKRRPV